MKGLLGSIKIQQNTNIEAIFKHGKSVWICWLYIIAKAQYSVRNTAKEAKALNFANRANS